MDERDDASATRRRTRRRIAAGLAMAVTGALPLAVGPEAGASAPGAEPSAAATSAAGLEGDELNRGAPVAPIPLRVEQPDGGSFRALPWGDGRNHGLETAAGYTVVQDSAGVWRYADGERADGQLQPDPARPDRQAAPADIDPGQRPEDPAPPADDDGSATPGLDGPSPSPEAGSPEPRNVGRQPTLVILGEHADLAHQTDPAHWHDMFFGATASVQRYYRDASFGQLDLVPAIETHGADDDGVIGWVDLGPTHPDTADSTDSRNIELTKAAITAASESIDFASYDTDDDGTVDPHELRITVIVAGYERAYSPDTCGKTVWAHSWGVGDPTFTADGRRIGQSYSQFGEMHCASDETTPSHAATLGIMVHELGHGLGWPDLYDVDDGDEGAGEWSVMASGTWNSAPGDPYAGMRPAMPDAWTKAWQGWITPTVLADQPGAIGLRQAASSPDALQLLVNAGGYDWQHPWIGQGSGEFFLVENRQRVGWDAGLPGCGLLVYHVDEGQGTNGSGDDTVGRLLTVEQADGRDDLGAPRNRGDGGDPFPGTSGNLSFSGASTPSSHLYDGSWSGVTLSVETTACAPLMEIAYERTAPPPPATTQPSPLDSLAEQLDALLGQADTAVADLLALVGQLLGG